VELEKFSARIDDKIKLDTLFLALIIKKMEREGILI